MVLSLCSPVNTTQNAARDNKRFELALAIFSNPTPVGKHGITVGRAVVLLQQLDLIELVVVATNLGRSAGSSRQPQGITNIGLVEGCIPDCARVIDIDVVGACSAIEFAVPPQWMDWQLTCTTGLFVNRRLALLDDRFHHGLLFFLLFLFLLLSIVLLLVFIFLGLLLSLPFALGWSGSLLLLCCGLFFFLSLRVLLLVLAPLLFGRLLPICLLFGLLLSARLLFGRLLVLALVFGQPRRLFGTTPWSGGAVCSLCFLCGRLRLLVSILSIRASGSLCS